MGETNMVNGFGRKDNVEKLIITANPALFELNWAVLLAVLTSC